jgi:hypothetical protein
MVDIIRPAGEGNKDRKGKNTIKTIYPPVPSCNREKAVLRSDKPLRKSEYFSGNPSQRAAGGGKAAGIGEGMDF